MKPKTYRMAMPGDILRPIPFWNECTSSIGSKLDDEVECIDVRQGTGSQSGVLYLVASRNGMTHWLDAAWFEHD